MILFLLACRGAPAPIEPGDTGGPTNEIDCSDAHCVDDAAVGLAPVDPTYAPPTALSDPATALVAKPAEVGDETYIAGTLSVVALPDLTITATWTGVGGPLAASAADPGVAAVSTWPGHVSVVDGFGSGAVDASAAAATIEPVAYDLSYGISLAIAPFHQEGASSLAVLEPGFDYGPDRYADGEVELFDLPLAGEISSADADVRLIGDPRFAGAMVAWDANGDGLRDIVLAGATVRSYPAPWTADLTAADADAEWPLPEPGAPQLTDVGDVDGDGSSDLALSSTTFPEPDRPGAVWILSGAGLSPVATITGDVPLEALGTSVTSGDLDGDGAPELVVGAAGLGATLGGLILAFELTSDGTLTPADALAALHGDHPHDHLGGAVLAVDPDGDGVSDVLACESGTGCFLVPGSALAP